MKIDKVEQREFKNDARNNDGFYMQKDGLEWYVPNDPDNTDYQEIDKQVKEGKIKVDKVKIN